MKKKRIKIKIKLGMFLLNWFYDILKDWGLMNKEAKILFLGLDNAGKTTLLSLLKQGRLSQHKPTRNPTHEELEMGNITFLAHDLGGHKEARKLWKDYFAGVDGIVYLVDVADSDDRIMISKEELDEILLDKNLKDVPIVVLGNKIDKANARNEPVFRQYMDLHGTTGKGQVVLQKGIRPIEVFMCSIVNRQGYGEGFEWLGQYI